MSGHSFTRQGLYGKCSPLCGSVTQAQRIERKAAG